MTEYIEASKLDGQPVFPFVVADTDKEPINVERGTKIYTIQKGE